MFLVFYILLEHIENVSRLAFVEFLFQRLAFFMGKFTHLLKLLQKAVDSILVQKLHDFLIFDIFMKNCQNFLEQIIEVNLISDIKQPL